MWERAWLHNWGSAFTWQRKGEFSFSLLHPGTFRISIDNQSATFSPGKVKSSRALGQNIVPRFQLKVLKIKPCVSDRSDRLLPCGCRSGSMWLLKSLARLLSTFVYTGVKWVMSLTASKEARTCCAARVVIAIVIVALKNIFITPQITRIASKVGEKCFWSRNMELQGLQEALKVEVQCHQVNKNGILLKLSRDFLCEYTLVDRNPPCASVLIWLEVVGLEWYNAKFFRLYDAIITLSADC